MTKGRLEAFSDGVFAIIITIMVLNLRVPHGRNLSDLRPVVPVFLSYVLSYLYVGIYWNNHHHLLHAAERVDGKSFGPTYTSCFGFRLRPSRLHGLVKMASTTGPWRRMGSCSFCRNCLLYSDEGADCSARAEFEDCRIHWEGQERFDVGTNSSCCTSDLFRGTGRLVRGIRVGPGRVAATRPTNREMPTC